MASRKAIQLHLGTMTFAWNQSSKPVDDATAEKFVSAFAAVGGTVLDTARIYAGGLSEEMLGRVLAKSDNKEKFTLVTKAHPSQPGGMSPEGIRSQLSASLKAINVPKVDVLYLHQPDAAHPLTETIAEADKLVKEGLVSTLGVSNFSVVETERLLAICEEKGYSKPSVFQGLYNPINRRVEKDLFPMLRKNGMSFVAYNPLAAGLLTGKHKQGTEVQAGRFKDNPNYLDRFYKSDNFAGLALIQAACDKHSIHMVNAAYTWLLCHSQLQDGDGLLLGASSEEQLQANLAACTGAEPLPAEVVQAYDDAWKLTEADAFAFWRGYSADHPGKDQLDQGASYAVKK